MNYVRRTHGTTIRTKDVYLAPAIRQDPSVTFITAQITFNRVRKSLHLFSQRPAATCKLAHVFADRVTRERNATNVLMVISIFHRALNASVTFRELNRNAVWQTQAAHAARKANAHAK